MSNFLNDLPGEIADPVPACSLCADSGWLHEEALYCECENGQAASHDACDDSADECAQARLDDMDYQSGVARGNLHAAERKIYGSALADEFAFMDEMNDYNNGLI